MVRMRRDSSGDVLEARSGGGCVGCLGVLFALWTSILGAFYVAGLRAGDFAAEDQLLMIVFPFFLCLFFLCGLGVGTYRRRYRFHATRRTVTHIEQVFFLPFQCRHWAIDDFSAVELKLRRSRNGSTTSRVHILRLLPRSSGGAAAEPCEIGSGGAGKEMRSAAVEISNVTGLPFLEPPAGVE